MQDLNQETFTVCAWANVARGVIIVLLFLLVMNRLRVGISFMLNPAIHGSFGQVMADGRSRSCSEPGEWQHIAGTYVDGTQKFYVNGELVGETASVP